MSPAPWMLGQEPSRWRRHRPSLARHGLPTMEQPSGRAPTPSRWWRLEPGPTRVWWWVRDRWGATSSSTTGPRRISTWCLCGMSRCQEEPRPTRQSIPRWEARTLSPMGCPVWRWSTVRSRGGVPPSIWSCRRVVTASWTPRQTRRASTPPRGATTGTRQRATVAPTHAQWRQAFRVAGALRVVRVPVVMVSSPVTRRVTTGTRPRVMGARQRAP